MRELAVAIQNENEKVSIIETINSIKNAGFKNVFVQWYDENWEHSQAKQIKLCKELGFNIIFAHLGYQNINSIWEEGIEGDRLVERYQRDIKECYENGIPMVIMHLTSKKKAPMYGEIGLNRIRKIVEYAKKLDMKVAFENTKIKGYLEYVINNIKDENVGICFDLPFDGTMDWKYVINKLKECNYNGTVTLELCYRYEYLNMPLDDFYKKGYDVGIKLAEKFED